MHQSPQLQAEQLRSLTDEALAAGRYMVAVWHVNKTGGDVVLRYKLTDFPSEHIREAVRLLQDTLHEKNPDLIATRRVLVPGLPVHGAPQLTAGFLPEDPEVRDFHLGLR